MSDATSAVNGAADQSKGASSKIVVRAPATGEVLGEVPILGEQEVRDAVRRARRAQQGWALLSVEERARRVNKVADAFIARAEELVDVLVREAGKPRNEALAHEVMVAVDVCQYFCRNAARILAERPIEMHLLKHRRSYIKYVPMGVVAVISPWNFPLLLSISPAFEALIAGNAVVVKPSEFTPLTMLKAKEIADDAGLPPDLLQVVTGDGATGAALIDAMPQKVVFIGAVSTGRRVAAACGERLIPCVLELGGKAALIATEDCEIERTARAIVNGGFANSGQICISVERVLAHEAVHDQLVERVVELVRELRQGDPASGEIDVGAMIFPKQLDIAEAHVRDATQKGAVIRTGGSRRADHGYFFEPTVIVGCTPEMSVMREEIFGPIVPFMKVRDEEEAVRIANDSHLGLNAYVFSRDRERAREIAERIEAGSVVINDVLSNYGMPEAPFGGIKQSGYGIVHSDESLRAMCYARHINYDRVTLPVKEPWLFPHTDRKYRAMLGALRALFGRHGLFGKISDLF